MEKPGVLDFKVGQLAEMKTFEIGYRGAWFRCKIMDIILKKNKIKLEYYDFEDEETSWEKIYQMPPYGRKSKHIKKQLMVRPQYPLIYHKNEIPPLNAISEVCVVIDGTWKIGDLVDWFKDDCYWSARVIKVLTGDKVQIELPMPPAGEGEEGEEGKHEVYCKDLRPYIDWSLAEGWTLPTEDGQTSCGAELIFPSKQGMDIEVENASSTTHISADVVDTELVDIVVCEEYEKSQEVKMDDDLPESSDSISSLRVQENKQPDEVNIDYNNTTTDLNIMHEDTVEAAILDLEELANKIKWMKNILETGQSSTNDATSWTFA